MTKNTSAAATPLTAEATDSRIPEPTSWDSVTTAPDTPAGSDPSATDAPVRAPWTASWTGPTERPDGQDRDHRNGHPYDDADDEGGRPAGPAAPLERRHGRQEGRGEGDRDDDRADHDGELREDGDHQREQAEGDEQTPAPLRQTVEPGRDVPPDRHADGAGRPEDIEHGPRDRHHDGDGRHRHEHAGEAAHREPDEQGEEDDRRMQLEGPVGQERASRRRSTTFSATTTRTSRSAVGGPPAARPARIRMPATKTPPMYGMKPAASTSTASGPATDTPIRVRTTKLVSASTAAIAAVPRT